MIKARVSLVDGGAMDMDISNDQMRRIQALRRAGVSGKEIIVTVLTDDWGPPPTVFHFRGSMNDGTEVDESILFDDRPANEL